MTIPRGTKTYLTEIGYYGVPYPDLTTAVLFSTDVIVEPCHDHKVRPTNNLYPVWVEGKDRKHLIWTSGVIN